MARRSDHSREELHRIALDAARTIVAADGLRGLSTRGIAKVMGYSPGTLYQLFDDLDDLIVHLNAETLDGLFEACRDVDLSAKAETALEELADRYIRYVEKNPRLWNALFEHQRPSGRDLPPWYYARTGKLIALGAEALLPIVGPKRREEAMLGAMVLWTGLYGVTALATSDKLGDAATPREMVHSLIRNYVAGLRALKGSGPRDI